MHTILVVLALLAAAAATLLGFDAFDSTSDPHTLGWLSLSIALLIGSKLVPKDS